MKLQKRVVRIKLTDILNSSHEPDILKKMNSIQKYNGIFFKLWYVKNEIHNSQLISFKTNYKEILDQGRITLSDDTEYSEFAWYEIANRLSTNLDDKYKFRSTYTTSTDIMTCLTELETFIKCSTSTTTVKKK
jgi:hypothetical protein